MTAAFNKALDLYPSPEGFEATKGLPDKMNEEQRKLATIAVRRRSALLSDEWPRMIRVLREVMEKANNPKPTALTPEEKAHHTALLYSEVGEFAEATDVIEQADGCLDVIVVALGALVQMGWSDTQIIAGFQEINCANMTKVQDNGRPLINDGKISPEEPIGKFLKTHNYVRPNLAEAMSFKGEES